jgi:hypothetical protein
MTTEQNIETDLTMGGTIAAAVGGSTGQLADAVIQSGEDVVNTAQAGVASHLTTLQTITQTAQKALADAPAVAATLAPGAAAKVQAVSTGLSSVLTDIENLLAEWGIKI